MFYSCTIYDINGTRIMCLGINFWPMLFSSCIELKAKTESLLKQLSSRVIFNTAAASSTGILLIYPRSMGEGLITLNKLRRHAHMYQ